MEQIFGFEVYLADWGLLLPNDPECMYCGGCEFWKFGILCPCKCYDEFQFYE